MKASKAEDGASWVALSWSGGKDSALALWALREELEAEPIALLTTITEDYDRVSMHAVRRELLRTQARATGIELVEIEIPAACVNETYEERMAQALARPPLDRAGTIAFADLFLADVRAYREERLATAGRTALFPLWGHDTAALAHEFVDAGFEAILVCVDPSQLDPSFVGRPFDEALLAELPPGVDPCGENGEFHTFAWDGPGFRAPVDIRVGATTEQGGFVVTDLLAAPSGSVPRDHGRDGPADPPDTSTD